VDADAKQSQSGRHDLFVDGNGLLGGLLGLQK